MSDPTAHDLPREPMARIASPQTVRSSLAEALRSAADIRDYAHRARVFARIATLLHRAGDASAVGDCLSSALAAAWTVPDDCIRASVLAEIARAQTATGEREAARTTLADPRALGQIGNANLIDHPLAKRGDAVRIASVLGHRRSPVIATARRRTVPTADRRRDRC